jgi:hypothetical protein
MLALELHPDRAVRARRTASRRFSAAYAVLSDPKRHRVRPVARYHGEAGIDAGCRTTRTGRVAARLDAPLNALLNRGVARWPSAT